MDDLLSALDSIRCWDPVENLSELRANLKMSLDVFQNFENMDVMLVKSHLGSVKARYHRYQRMCSFPSYVDHAMSKYLTFYSLLDIKYMNTYLQCLIQSMLVDRLILLHIESPLNEPM